ncbi:MAG TPA: Flp pilus assembly protein CpaB [Solirubrobacterales bacterium]|nr:Flp pilus assembly protein CpaB [Solirubrobacterales bacterium]
MSRRGRAAAFAIVALGCAVLAAVIANGYGTSVASQYGALRPVLVASTDLAPGAVIDARDLGRRVEVRRVPESFIPPDALASLGDVVGRAPAAPVPAGSYLLDSQLEVPHRSKRGGHPALADGLRPVEIAVTGAEALSAAGGSPDGMRVDVVVTTEPDVGDKGRTFVAAEGVELLALSDTGGVNGDDELGGSASWSATLALTRAQALRLIQAENFARQVRLMPHV